MTEWRIIEGTDNMYEVSDSGQIRSVPRTLEFMCKGKLCSRRFASKILKLTSRSGGYLGCLVPTSRTPQKLKWIHVHRAVAEAFLPNPDNLKFVIHKDGNRFDNRVSNLVWSNTIPHDKIINEPWIVDCKTHMVFYTRKEAEGFYGHTQLLRALKGGQRWYGHTLRYMTPEEMDEFSSH